MAMLNHLGADEARTLRDQIAAALYEHTHPGSYWSDTSMPADWRPTYLDEADAVLAVLPEPGTQTDRGAALREAADRYEEILANADTGADPRYWTAVRDITLGLRRLADETQPGRGETDPLLLDELQRHLAEHTPSCNARTDHLMRRAAWALGALRPEHIGGNAEDCPGCEGTNPPYPFICPGPDAPAAGAGQDGAQTAEDDPLCVCMHRRSEHVTVSGRLLCDSCDPDCTENLVCKEFDAL